MLLVWWMMALRLMAAEVVVIVHDPKSAVEAEPMKALAAAWKPLGVDAVVMDQVEYKKRMGGLKAAAVVNYIHHEFDSAVEEQMIRWTEAGGRLIVLHHGMASGKMKSAKWPGFMGVKILPKDHPQAPWKVHMGRFHLVNLQPGHFVTTHGVKYEGGGVSYMPSDGPAAEQWVEELVFEDTEIFHNQLFTDGRQKTVLFGIKGETVEGKLIEQDRGGWMKAAGKGWIFYFQPGHFARDFGNKGYMQVLTNAVRWR